MVPLEEQLAAPDTKWPLNVLLLIFLRTTAFSRGNKTQQYEGML